MNDIPENWSELEPIYIFMIGIISTYPPYDEMTPDQIWDDIKTRFTEAEK